MAEFSAPKESVGNSTHLHEVVTQTKDGPEGPSEKGSRNFQVTDNQITMALEP